MISSRGLTAYRHQTHFGLTLLLFLLGASWLAGCDQAPPLQTAPSPLPAEKVGVLAVTCSPAITRQSMSLADPPIAVTFAPPLTTGGQAPVTASCTRESGSLFPVGMTDVTCNAADSLGQDAACAFSIVVRPTARLRATSFLAFGDSITAGVVSNPFVFGTLTPSEAYTVKLETKLAQEFPLQMFSITNAGLPGELAALAASRFATEFNRVRPEAVLLVEGTNDILDGAAAVPGAIAGLEAMVVTAKAGGAEVLLATVPPQRNHPTRDLAVSTIPLLNDEIRALALRQGVGLVDLFSALDQAVCPSVLSFAVSRFHETVPCIGEDHLHPTPAGYDVMAETFKQAILETFGVNLLTLRSTALPARSRPRVPDLDVRPSRRPLRPTQGLDRVGS